MDVKDKSGYVVFSNGEIGSAHVMAHELLDSGQVALGHERLKGWLAGRAGSGSDWAHIQFHMAVFELGVGDWKGAYARFLEELAPIAATTQDALTDAPALAWRLSFDAGRRNPLPWESLRNTALASTSADPFVEVHKLLALAGAHDTESLDEWLYAHRDDVRSPSSATVVRMAEALGAYAHKHYRRAAGLLREVVPELPSIGGSSAQNGLFTELQGRLASA